MKSDRSRTMLITGGRGSSGLYASVASGPLDALAPAVLSLHFGNGDTHARGIFAVRHGSNPVARALARLFRFPAESRATPVDLVIQRQGADEVWIRSFAGHPLRSLQRRVRVGVLGERFGPCEFRFLVSASDGVLRLTTAGFAIRFGLVAIPLARRVAPCASGRVRSGDDGLCVSVILSAPVIGLLLAYEGHIREVA
jgi:hypothetical protein